jgi:hypothetical protein
VSLVLDSSLALAWVYGDETTPRKQGEHGHDKTYAP